MQSSEDSPLAPFDPEPERTFLARRRAASEVLVEDLGSSESNICNIPRFYQILGEFFCFYFVYIH
jgi:hypothetical protein